MQVQSVAAYDSGSNVFYTGIARCSGMTVADTSLWWSVLLDPASAATTVNDAIKTAGIAAAATAGITVGALDTKTLIGAAVAL